LEQSAGPIADISATGEKCHAGKGNLDQQFLSMNNNMPKSFVRHLQFQLLS